MKRPLVYMKGVKPMDTMEVLTLLLVIFAGMTYLDIHREHHDNNKKNSIPPPKVKDAKFLLI